MWIRGPSLYLALWGILSLTQSALAANEAFGSLMLFLYKAYRFDESATNGKPGLANDCKPHDSDGPSSDSQKGCNFHGFLRHVLNSDYDPKGHGFKKVSNAWMPTENEVAYLQDWDSVDADKGYSARKVMGKSGNFFNAHLMFRVVAARVRKLASDHPDSAKGVYAGMLSSVDKIQFSMRSGNAANLIKTAEGILGKNKDKLVTSNVGGLYGLKAYKQLDIQSTTGTLSGDALSDFQSKMKGNAKSKLKSDDNVAFRDIVLLRDEFTMEVGGTTDRCGGRNRDSGQRDENDKNKEDEKNQSCMKGKDKRGFFGSLADAVLKRQAGGNNGKACKTKTETTLTTLSHTYYTPSITCDPLKHTQACYHYRCVHSASTSHPPPNPISSSPEANRSHPQDPS